MRRNSETSEKQKYFKLHHKEFLLLFVRLSMMKTAHHEEAEPGFHTPLPLQNSEQNPFLGGGRGGGEKESELEYDGTTKKKLAESKCALKGYKRTK